VSRVTLVTSLGSLLSCVTALMRPFMTVGRLCVCEWLGLSLPGPDAERGVAAVAGVGEAIRDEPVLRQMGNQPAMDVVAISKPPGP
jgi:hypothetical protein